MMATRNTYVVAVDISMTSGAALDYAAKLSRETNGRLLLLHAIPSSAIVTSGPYEGSPEFTIENEKAQREEARSQMEKLIRKKRLKPGTFRSLIVTRGDPARVIANHANKARASMIVMGTHGRTGLKRLLLGSVAERTLRYARCPVLIIKK
jgi:nucleotide-binding universal stress UspA family protein